MFVTAAMAATEAVGEAAHEGGGVFPPFDPSHFASQLFWLALSFGAFYVFISRVALPRIGDVLETRATRIAKDLDEANAMKSEADNALAEYEQSLASARTNANDIAGKARDAAKASAEQTRAKIEADLAVQMQDAEIRIGDVKAKAMGNLNSIAEETAGAIVTQLLGGKFDKADIVAAVKAARAG
jgi:F-type H+-transporting ATPase subunit b